MIICLQRFSMTPCNVLVRETPPSLANACNAKMYYM